MERSRNALSRRRTGAAFAGQGEARERLQRAIDSLRRGSPPSAASPAGEASTEADRDRALRDELLDAMREGAPPGFGEAVDRYYEELLR
jgi:hypothetical protein